MLVIEHMEEEVFEWSKMEYRHVAEVVGKERLMLTNIPEGEVEGLREIAGRVETRRLGELADVAREGMCLLDPYVETELSPEDAGRFTHVVVGGILGDAEYNGRTIELRDDIPGATGRHLGPRQMTTDTAAIVAHRVFAEGLRLGDFSWIDDPEVRISAMETQSLPFRYISSNGEPLFPKGLINELTNC